MSYEQSREELYHHGILNQKWGVRRYQNEDGSLTSLGRKHYGYGDAVRSASKVMSKASNLAKQAKDAGIDNAIRTAKQIKDTLNDPTDTIKAYANKVEDIIADKGNDLYKYLSNPSDMNAITKKVSRSIADISDSFIDDVYTKTKAKLTNGSEMDFKKTFTNLARDTGSFIGYNGHKLYRDISKSMGVKPKFELFGATKAAAKGAAFGKTVGRYASEALYPIYKSGGSLKDMIKRR